MGAQLNHPSHSASKACGLAQVSFALETTRLGELLVELDLCDGTGLQVAFSSPESTWQSPSSVLFWFFLTIKHVYVGCRVKKFGASIQTIQGI